MPKRRANGEGNIRKRKDGRWEGRYTAGYDPESGKRIIKNVLGKTQVYAFLRCFRPGFSVRGSQRGSMSISMTFAQLLVVLLLRDLALTASAAYGKIFLDSKQLW